MSVYDRIRHESAGAVAGEPAVGDVGDLDGRSYCVLVTYRRDGTPMPTPVWFGLREGRVYLRTEADSWKIRRIRNDDRVRVAPCTVRGRPLGPPFEGTARVLDDDEWAAAEEAIASNYGGGRRMFNRLAGEAPDEVAYVEIVAAASVPVPA